MPKGQENLGSLIILLIKRFDFLHVRMPLFLSAGFCIDSGQDIHTEDLEVKEELVADNFTLPPLLIFFL